MTTTPREAAEAMREAAAQALANAAEFNMDNLMAAFNFPDEQADAVESLLLLFAAEIRNLPLLAAPSEPTAEGRDYAAAVLQKTKEALEPILADVRSNIAAYERTLERCGQEAEKDAATIADLRADLNCMKAAMEAIYPALKVLHTMLMVAKLHGGASKAVEMMGWIDEALGREHAGTSPSDMLRDAALKGTPK